MHEECCYFCYDDSSISYFYEYIWHSMGRPICEDSFETSKVYKIRGWYCEYYSTCINYL